MSVTFDRSVVYPYNWNTVESGGKHPQTNNKHIKSVIIMCPINIYKYIGRAIIFLLHRFIFNFNAVGIRLVKLLFNNRFKTIICVFLKINISDIMMISAFLYFTMTVHYLYKCISRIPPTVSKTKIYEFYWYTLVIGKTYNTMAQRRVWLLVFVKIHTGYET